MRLVQSRHGLNDQQVNSRSRAVPGQNADLLGKCRARFVQSGFTQRLQTHAQGPDRTRNPRGNFHIARLLFLQTLDRLPRQANARGVDLGHFSRQAVSRQPEAVGAESIGFKNLRTSLQILLMHAKDQIGVRQVQLVIAAVDEDAARVEHRAHGAIGKHGAVGKKLGKAGHSVVMLPHCCWNCMQPHRGSSGSLPRPAGPSLALLAPVSTAGTRAGTSPLVGTAPAPRATGWLCYTSLVITCVEIGFGYFDLNDFRVHALPFLCRGSLRRSINRGLGF